MTHDQRARQIFVFAKSVGQRVRTLRIGAEMNQGEVAAELLLHQSAISRIENGSQHLSFEEANRLTEVLDCSLNDLILSEVQ